MEVVPTTRINRDLQQIAFVMSTWEKVKWQINPLSPSNTYIHMCTYKIMMIMIVYWFIRNKNQCILITIRTFSLKNMPSAKLRLFCSSIFLHGIDYTHFICSHCSRVSKFFIRRRIHWDFPWHIHEDTSFGVDLMLGLLCLSQIPLRHLFIAPTTMSLIKYSSRLSQSFV